MTNLSKYVYEKYLANNTYIFYIFLIDLSIIDHKSILNGFSVFHSISPVGFQQVSTINHHIIPDVIRFISN